MAALSFPPSPANGDTYGNYVYSSAKGVWVSALAYNYVSRTNGSVTTANSSSSVVRNITLSTTTPTGGSAGDLWFRYV